MEERSRDKPLSNFKDVYKTIISPWDQSSVNNLKDKLVCRTFDYNRYFDNKCDQKKNTSTDDGTNSCDYESTSSVETIYTPHESTHFFKNSRPCVDLNRRKAISEHVSEN